jgi:hypothetical protein
MAIVLSYHEGVMLVNAHTTDVFDISNIAIESRIVQTLKEKI